MRVRRPILALVLAGLPWTQGCRSSEGSITLIYPADYPRDAVQLLDVFTIKREDLAVADVSCESLLAKAVEGAEPAGSEQADVPLSPPFDGRTIQKFPRGTPIVFVTGYNDSSDIRKPVVVGCTEEFDSSGGADVEIPLQVLIPVDTLVSKATGDLQVTGVAGPLPQPLCVLVNATTPNLRDQRYGLPGIAVQFKPDPMVALGDSAPGQMVELITQANGQACVPASLPAENGYFEVQVVAPELFADRPTKEPRSKATFLLSSVAPINFATNVSSFTPGVPGRPVALDAGDVNGDGFVDLAVLTCEGAEPGCRMGTAAEAPFGAAHLSLYSNVLDPSSRAESRRLDLGRLPSGLRLGRFSSLNRSDVAVLNGRSEACLNRRSRPCQNSEIRFLRWQGDGLVDAERVTITASNAVGLTAMPTLSGASPTGYESLSSAGQGRRENTQPCKLNVCLPFDPFCAHPQCLSEKPCDCTGGACVCGDGEVCFEESGKNLCRPVKRSCAVGDARCVSPEPCNCQGDRCACPTGTACFRDEATPLCLPYESACRLAQECGCPAGEMCECPPEQGCAADAVLGFCHGRDREIEVIHNRGGTRFESREACTEPVLTCAKTGSGRPVTSCRCLDNPVACSGRDDCGCAVPNRITLTGRGVTPNQVGAGVLRENGVEFVVATAGGLDFVAKGTGETYAWADRPVVNAPIHGVQVVDLDGDVATDLVWFARTPCAQGPNLQRQCPLVDSVGLEPGSDGMGCFGVYLRYVDPTKQRPSDSPISGSRSCRRFALDVRPADMCTGDFNGDGNADVALSSDSSSEILVLAGDGRGGVLYPAQKVSIPASGGALTCIDLNGDGLTDMAVASRASGQVFLIESRRSP